MNSIRKSFVAILLSGLASVHAHSQEPSRVDLNVEKNGSVQMWARLPLVLILWRQQAPNSSLVDFLAEYANLDDRSLNLAYQKLQDGFATQTRLVVNGSLKVGFQDWRWPETAQLRASMQRLLPSVLSELEVREILFQMFDIHAQGKAFRRIDNLVLVLPARVDSLTPNILWPAPSSPVAPKPKSRSGTKAPRPTSPGPR